MSDAQVEAVPMPDATLSSGIGVVETSPEDGRAMLDRVAREELNISGAEFLAKWDAGGFEHVDDPAVTRVSMLIPFAR